jgi:hypothetical protein
MQQDTNTQILHTYSTKEEKQKEISKYNQINY